MSGSRSGPRRFTLRVAREGGGWTQEWDVERAGCGRRHRPRPPPRRRSRSARACIAVRPPLPGTFYRAPQPGAPPFVEVGDAVGPDTVVAIIETMKLMNPVHAGAAGTIEAILFDNAAPVEAEAVLMIVRPPT